MPNAISGIGEYIHYHDDMYREYGTVRKNSKSGKATAHNMFNTAHQQQMKLVRDKVNQMQSLTTQQCKELELRINTFMNLLAEGQTNPDPQIEAIQNRLLEKIFGEGWEQKVSTVNWANLALSIASGEQGIPQFRKGFEEYSGNWEQKVMTRISRINQKLQEMANTVNNVKTREDVPSASDALKKTENWLLQTLEEMDNELVKENLKAKTPKGEYGNLREYLNKLIATYAPFMSISKAQGSLFEYVADAAVRQYANIMRNEIGEVAQAMTNLQSQGDIKTPNPYNKGAFSSGMLEKGKITESKTNLYKFNNIVNKVSESYGKVDATWEVMGTTIGASLKSVNLGKTGLALSKPIHISTGNPLLQYLQDEDTEFINHFLNIYSVHDYSLKQHGADNGDPNEGGSNAGLYDAEKHQIRQALKLSILYKALTGDTYGSSEMASIFVVNNSKYAGNDPNGHVKVYNMIDILKTALETAADDLDQLLDITTVPANLFIDNFHFNNNWVDEEWGATGTERIASVLNQLYEMKVRASIKNRLLVETANRIGKI